MWLQIIKQAHQQLFSELKAHISKNILPIIVAISALLLFFGALFGGFWLISEIVSMFFGPDPIGIAVFLACFSLYLGSLMGYTIYIGNTIHELHIKFTKDKKDVFRNLSE